MTYSIRLFRVADAQSIADITLAAIRAIGPRYYDPDQVREWAARHPGAERILQRAANGDLIFVAIDAHDCAVAYALLETDGHLDMLYCHPDHSRQGLADRLLAHSEMHAKDCKITRLYTEASELARPVFERAGYTLQYRRDFEINGVPIHNYAMEKRLT